jgi:hypothetical protein
MKLGGPIAIASLSAVAAVIAFVACGKETPYVPGPYGTNLHAAANCEIDAGLLPSATCDGTNNPTGCNDVKPGCDIEPAAQCGDKNTCLPMADNTGKTTLDLRIRRLNVFSPATLAQPFVEKAIVDKGVNLQQCGEGGDGSFNWLVRIDKSASTIRTGGAPPTADPFGLGFCFADTTSGAIHIQPVTAKYMAAQDGTLVTEMIPKLNVPIWLHGDRNTLVILPLTQVIIKGVQVSPEGNCIGSFNYAHVNADCTDSREDCARWTPAGSLGGFITLEEADGVELADLGGKSLCVLLTGKTSTTDPLKCPRDGSGKISATGDYCSSPAGPGGCLDSYWLSATFAASAVKINDGSGDDLCKGGTIQTDGGTEGGTDGGTDAASDAPGGG